MIGWDELRDGGPIASMRTSGGLDLELTPNDALWMARAIMGEGPRDADLVTATMLRRWAFVRDQRAASWPSLTAMVVGTESNPRGYSQPVSVYWRTRGPEARQRRRARIRSLTWEQCDEDVRRTVLEMFTGARELVAPGAVHFADGAVTGRRLREEPGRWFVVARRRNTFLAVPGSRSYADPAFTPLRDLGLGGGRSGPFATTLLLLVGGATLYLASQVLR